MRRVVLRADASPSIGAGHLMRCLALAHAIKASGVEPIVATRTDSEGLLQHLRRAGIDVVRISAGGEAEDAARAAELARGGAVVVDGYHFGETYLDALRRCGCRIVLIDDVPRMASYDVDILLDQNPGALRQPYHARSSRLLLGPRFMLLRPEFADVERRAEGRGRPRVLVTFGASDAAEVTTRVLQALETMEDVDASIVLGSINQRADGVVRRFGDVARFDFVMNSDNMPSLMAQCDVAVAGVGVTLWELAAVGVPTLTISSTDVQRPIAAVADQYGAYRWVGDASEIDVSDIRSAVIDLLDDVAGRVDMARLGRALVDGRGAERVAHAMAVPGDTGWAIRPAGPDDVEPLWEIASDPTVRRMAFDPAAFAFPQHERWFASRLVSADTRFWVAERDGTIGGFVRYDRVDARRADIDVAVAAAARGGGLGTRLLAETCWDACGLLGVASVRGVVFTENDASQRAFSNANFAVVGAKTIEGRSCTVYEHAVTARASLSS